MNFMSRSLTLCFVGFWSKLLGAVSIRFEINGRSLAIINTHLPHGTEQDQYQARLDSIPKIFSSLNFGNYSSLLDHEWVEISNPSNFVWSDLFKIELYFSAVVWMGDMNFRIRDFTREEVISKVQGKLSPSVSVIPVIGIKTFEILGWPPCKNPFAGHMNGC